MVKQIMIVVMLVMALLLSGCGQINEEEEVTASTYSQIDQETSAIFTEETPLAESSEIEEPVTVNSEPEESTGSYEITESIEEEAVMRLYIGEVEVPVTWEDNGTVQVLRDMLPMTIQMRIYSGFEQVGPIPHVAEIFSQDEQITTEPGDIVLYSSNQIVIFYGSNTWAYTRLGHIELDQSEMGELLGNGNVEITITMD